MFFFYFLSSHLCEIPVYAKESYLKNLQVKQCQDFSLYLTALILIDQQSIPMFVISFNKIKSMYSVTRA